MISSGNLSFKKKFGRMYAKELNPEDLGSLWLKASATWGGGINFG
jgi:hypothetical protein